ncbi:hypothetical protein R3P38DRAFT_3202736 [Favolaschia claudopus]|uniref:Uncharacterized protein n=1 Tax=Favolaschia claudopus TaxID=2862362 RepID=A0AAW0ASQ1_9AGAR
MRLQMKTPPRAPRNCRSQTQRVAVLVNGKQRDELFFEVHPVPGPTGGLSFIGGYSEIYPDFIGNYHRLLACGACLVSREGSSCCLQYYFFIYLYHRLILSSRHIYLTDDPDCAGVVLKESEYFTKKIDENSPLAPFKLSEFGNGIFTSDSDDWEGAEGHKFDDCYGRESHARIRAHHGPFC